MKLLHILELLFNGLIAVSMTQHLDCRREALDCDIIDEAFPCEPLCRKDPILSVFHPVYTVPTSVEDDCMHIDLQTQTVGENE